MKMRTILCCLLLSLLLQPSAFPQGLLTPPGPPAPTMKALDEIEPRINIQRTVNPLPSDATYRYIINTPGSYYLSANLEASNSGIRVTVQGVTIDLNGFQISGTGGASGDGIRVDSVANNCTIKNGSVTGFQGIGINAFSSGGIISHVFASNCNAGIDVGESWRIDSCNARDNIGNGIFGGGRTTISYCSATSNGGLGIRTGLGSTITSCTASGNRGSAGISIGSGSTITQCTAAFNAGTGSSSAGIVTGSNCTIIGCTSNSNNNTSVTLTGETGGGIFVDFGSTVRDCSTSQNLGDGIRASSNVTIIANNSFVNGASGVRVTSRSNRIEGNHVSFNLERGIDVRNPAGGQIAEGNLIIKNSATGNTTNYEIAPDNRYGPIIDLTATGTPFVVGNSANDTTGTTHPWANFAQ